MMYREAVAKGEGRLAVQANLADEHKHPHDVCREPRRVEDQPTPDKLEAPA